MKRIPNISLALTLVLCATSSCSSSTTSNDNGQTDSIATAKLEAARLDSIRLDSIRLDSIRHNTLLEFGCTALVACNGNDIKPTDFDSKLKALGFKCSARVKTYEGEGDYDEWVKSYTTKYTYIGDSGKITIIYDVTEYNLFSDFTWTITFDNPKQREKFIQSLYDFGYNKAEQESNFKTITRFKGETCPSIGWNIYEDKIVSYLSTC